jgi:non-ribosomal peptide synthetase component F
LQEMVARLRDRRSPITVPIDRPRPLHTSHRAAAIPFVVPDHVSRDLRAVARREGMTTFMLGLAALALAIRAEVQHAEEATFGIAVANRPSVEAQALIGAFVNIVVVRLVMPAELTVRDLLRQARAAMLDAFAYQDVPFDDAMEALEPGTPKGSYGPQGGEPLFRVCVDFQEGGDRPTAPPPDLTVTAIDADEAKSGCDLFLSLSSDLNTLRGLLLYSTELYELRTALKFVDRVQAAFAALATRLDCRATDVCRATEVRP